MKQKNNIQNITKAEAETKFRELSDLIVKLKML